MSDVPQVEFLPAAEDVIAELDDEPTTDLGVAPEPVEGEE